MRIQYRRSFLERLWRISFKRALLVSSPIFIVISILTYQTYNTIALYAKWNNNLSFIELALKDAEQLPLFNLDILHYHFNEQLRKIFNYLTAAKIPENDGIPVFSLYIDPVYIEALNSDLPRSGRDQMVPAVFNDGNRNYNVKARYRGGSYWHWDFAQKSWRLKLSDGQMFNRGAKLNLLNPKDILSFNEITSMYLAKEAGLMAPDCFSLKLIENRKYKGFYMYLQQIDEHFIRANKKIPGNIYYGDLSPLSKVNGVPILWQSFNCWDNVYSPFKDDQNKGEDLKSFLEVLNDPDHKKFYSYALSHLDIDNYCSYAGFDSIVGCFHHSYLHNNKLFFDSITGKFIAIPWDVFTWSFWNTPFRNYDLSATQLLHKWKLIPKFEYKRQLRIWELINGQLSQEKILERLDSDYEKTFRVMQSDRFRDGINDVPLKYLHYDYFIVRPFMMTEFKERYKQHRDVITKRNKFLRDYLSDSNLRYLFRSLDTYCQLDIEASGTAGVQLNEFVLGVKVGRIKVYKDINRNNILDHDDLFVNDLQIAEDSIIFSNKEKLFPGFNLVFSSNRAKVIGTYDYVPSPMLYTYFFVGGEIEEIKIIAQNAVTGEPVIPSRVDAIDFSLSEQTDSLHPWDIPQSPDPEEKVFGPGEVRITETVIYPSHITVRILPGTKLFLSPGVSVVFRCKVIAEGINGQPIIITSSKGGEYFNSFALQGKGTSGSTFSNCVWENGSKDKVDLIYYPAMLCAYDTDNVTFTNCKLMNNGDGSSGLRIGYGKDILISGCEFNGLKDNALLLDISVVKIESTKFESIIGNGINVVNSQTVINKTLFKKIKSRAVFSREDSVLSLNNCEFTESNVCVEAQDESNIIFDEVSFDDSTVAIKLSKGIYPETPVIVSDEIFVSSCHTNILNETKTNIDIKKITNSYKQSVYKDQLK